MRTITLTAALVAILSPAVQAEGLPIEPGMWEATTTMTMPMMPQPQVNTMKRCFDQSEITTEDFNREGVDPGCEFTSTQIDGNTMAWTVDCPVEGGGTSHGEWQATSEGDRVTGSGKFSVDFQGQTMEMSMSWEGRRIGDC